VTWVEEWFGRHCQVLDRNCKKFRLWLRNGIMDHVIIALLLFGIVNMKNERDSGTDDEKGGDGGSYVMNTSLLA
jgi:hypothetical protein